MVDHLCDIGGLRLHVAEWGDRQHPPLFMLHGLASTHHMFDLIAETLAQRFHVFAFDQRGHGQSDKPNKGYDFETISRDLDGLITRLCDAGQAVTLIGHSWGACTTLYYAATRPQRLTQAVMLDGGLRPLRERYATWAEAEIGMAPPDYTNLDMDGVLQRIRDWLGPAWRPDTEKLALSVFDMSDPHAVHARLSRANHLRIARALWKFRPSDWYSSVECPLLMVNAIPPGQGMTLKMLSDCDRALEEINDGEAVWMPDTTHDIPWHRPQELADILDRFLQQP